MSRRIVVCEERKITKNKHENSGKEDEIHIQAFEHYYSQGPERTYGDTARTFKVSRSAIYQWATKYDWHNRIRERNKRLVDELDKKCILDAIATRFKYKKQIEGLLDTFFRSIKKDQSIIKSIDDMERLVRLSLLLVGQSLEQKGEEVVLEKQSILFKGLENNTEAQGALKQLYRAINQEKSLPIPREYEGDEN